MSDGIPGRSGHCYRHPDRESYVLCQRCGRTICPECRTEAPVGFHCPECLREARASAPSARPVLLRTARRLRTGTGPVATYSLIAITAVVYALQLVVPGVTGALSYQTFFTASRPWTLLTSVFLHSGVLHIAFNMLSLWIFGRVLEEALGRWRFVALYLLSGLGGSLAVLLLNPGGGVLGASGAVFGLMGAYFVISRRMGVDSSGLVAIILLNLATGFFLPNISWQAHVGGLVIGCAVAFIYLRTRPVRLRWTQFGLLAGLAVVLVAGVGLGYARLVGIYS
jgi:membrane associated rhomboid family serine protease